MDTFRLAESPPSHSDAFKNVLSARVVTEGVTEGGSLWPRPKGVTERKHNLLLTG